MSAAVATPAEAVVSYTDLYTLGTPSGYLPGYVLLYHVSAEGFASGAGSMGTTRPLMWTPESPNGFDPSPPNTFAGGQRFSYHGRQVGGYTPNVRPYEGHAYLISGTSASAVDLHPQGSYASEALAADDTQQVGLVVPTQFGNVENAYVWSGSAATGVNLHAADLTSSEANGVRNGVQVGSAYGTATGNAGHAMMWRGTPESRVDLNPTGFLTSSARGTDGVWQVGSGVTRVGSGPTGTLVSHALLWKGSASSVVDLGPAGFSSSAAVAVEGDRQVGAGSGSITGGNVHALMWNGSAADYLDLGALLPETFTSSYATSVQGDRVTGYAVAADGTYHVIAWTVPEPTGAAAAAVVLGLLRRRRA